MPRLVVHEPGGVRSSVAVEGELQIGRDAGMALVLGDGKVSRHHATIAREDGAWIVCDADSRHGTFVNGERVQRHVLRDGDQLQIGSTVLAFEQADDTSAVQLHIAADPAAGASAETAHGEQRDERLQVFYQLAEATAAIDDADAALRRALAAIVAVLGCERGVIALGDSAQTLRRAAEVQARELVISRSVIDGALTRGEALLLGGDLVEPHSLVRQGVRSAMAAPLRVRQRTLGLVYVDDRGRADRFGKPDLELLVAVARLAGVIVDVSARYERAVALVEVAQAERVAPELIGKSEQIRQVRREVERFGATELPIHLTGESGVGKELVARAIHQASSRSGASFVAVNCAAMPDTLLESELFGHVRGAFTGADKARRGKLALADHGTLFLDEVADLSPAAQAKLLRVLEDGEVVPVGSETAIRVDLRVVSASHKDLRRAVADGRFRQDLYYRLAGAEIAIPPLRERGADVIELAETFLSRVRVKRPGPSRLSAEAVAALASYAWPGNVRELRHAIERACAIAIGDVIEAGDLALRAPLVGEGAPPVARGSLASQYAALDATEKKLVEEAMAKANGNVSEAARLLGITRIMMKRRIDRFASAGPESSGEPE
ncbi:MAG TPA: sigma 54-interacting transcriptional regulator [Kofleriaceae bacterium]|nr:sigma 54-interacting transcriptional regulator [Kofleriaceae bacterium]